MHPLPLRKQRRQQISALVNARVGEIRPNLKKIPSALKILRMIFKKPTPFSPHFPSRNYWLSQVSNYRMCSAQALHHRSMDQTRNRLPIPRYHRIVNPTSESASYLPRSCSRCTYAFHLDPLRKSYSLRARPEFVLQFGQFACAITIEGYCMSGRTCLGTTQLSTCAIANINVSHRRCT